MRLALVTVIMCGMVGAASAVEKAAATPEPPVKPSAKPVVKPVVLDLGEGVSVEVVRVRGGKFTMGSPKAERCRRRDESPMREVTISRDFLMSRCEITRAQFAAFVKATEYKTESERDGEGFAWDGKKWDKVKGSSWRDIGHEQGENHPVVGVTWNDAVAFCKWITAKTGRPARLPTEAEWEYACRAGTQTIFSWGDTLEAGGGTCNVADKAARGRFRRWKVLPFDDGYVFTAPVGSFKPNAFGLHDMHGNVWEWCSDFYARDYSKLAKIDPKGPESGKIDPKDPESCTYRTLRGGSWMSSAPFIRSAHRRRCPPKGFGCDNMAGIRLVIEIPQPADSDRSTRSKKPSKP